MARLRTCGFVGKVPAALPWLDSTQVVTGSPGEDRLPAKPSSDSRASAKMSEGDNTTERGQTVMDVNEPVMSCPVTA